MDVKEIPTRTDSRFTVANSVEARATEVKER
jgi:hypothetical protein